MMQTDRGRAGRNMAWAGTSALGAASRGHSGRRAVSITRTTRADVAIGSVLSLVIGIAAALIVSPR